MNMVSPAKGYVSSEYGYRDAIPGVTSGTFHAGIDIANDIGTNIYAAFAGTVVESGWNIVKHRTGKAILIRNSDGEYQYYGHLSKILVSNGDRVDAGEHIGEMGDTGNVTGPHLHFGIWNRHQKPRNPRIDFKHFGIEPGSAPRNTSGAGGGSTGGSSDAWPDVQLLTDGHFGPVTKTAYQHLLAPDAVGGYDGRIDGKFGKLSIQAEQRWLDGLGYYDGRIDGKRGPMTIKALQSFLYDKGAYENDGYSKSIMVDGEFGARSVIGLQRYLNDQAQYYR